MTLKGVRTEHDIDVVVDINLAGFGVRWLVECKHWKSAVTKLQVLALREIVAELGADRGILLCEAGFRSGAFEAANLTNVQVTSLAALSATSREEIYAVRLRELFDLTATCRIRYWDLPKDVRIANGLRFGVVGRIIGPTDTYSGARVIGAAAKSWLEPSVAAIQSMSICFTVRPSLAFLNGWRVMPPWARIDPLA